MPEYKVQCYQGADHPIGGWRDIEAADEKCAARNACGEEVREGGRNGELCAIVMLRPKPSTRAGGVNPPRQIPFYSLPAKPPD